MPKIEGLPGRSQREKVDQNLLIHDPELAKRQRLEEINSVLAKNDLAGQFSGIDFLGDNGRYEEVPGQGSREIEILRIEGGVTDCGEGLAMVHYVTQNMPPTTENSGEGHFRILHEKESAAQDSHLLVPVVFDAPTDTQFPTSILRTDNPAIAEVNHQLAELHLKQLPPTAGAGVDNIVGIKNIVTENGKFYNVVDFEVKRPSGELYSLPIVYNANSEKGIDGVVFATIVRLQGYGNEPRILLGSAWRLTQGTWQEHEAARGFYSPRKAGEEAIVIKQYNQVPALHRALEEARDEMAVVSVDAITDLGTSPQNPAFEASVPHFYALDLTVENFGQQDLEASEKFNLKNPLSLGEFFAAIGETNEPFTLTALGKMLIRKQALRLNKRGLEAQQDGARMVLRDVYRPQHGRFMTEVLRGAKDSDLPLNSLGQMYVNNGIARIAPDLSMGITTWEELINETKNMDQQRFRLLYPHEALSMVGNSQLDIITTASIIKALHANNWLEINLASM